MEPLDINTVQPSEEEVGKVIKFYNICRFLFTVIRKILLEFNFYFNELCNMFLSKVQQSYCYT